MSLEVAMKSASAAHAGLTALIAGRFHESISGQKSTLPYVVCQRISTMQRPYVFGNTTPHYATARMQVDCFAATMLGVMALADQVRSCFDRWQGTIGGQVIQDSMIENQYDTTELEDTATQLRRMTFDFMITYNEA